jgi:hypothetical protein
MPRRQEEFTLDGETYRVTQLGALEGRRLMVRFVKGLAPMLEQIKLDFSAVGKGGKAGLVGSLLEAQVEKTILPAIGGFLEQLDEKLFEELCDKFARLTEVRVDDQHGERWPDLNKVFDDHFAGRYGHMLRWFLRCLAINGGDFLPDLARMSRPAAATETPSK